VAGGVGWLNAISLAWCSILPHVNEKPNTIVEYNKINFVRFKYCKFSVKTCKL
jgi:hypothetical protein